MWCTMPGDFGCRLGMNILAVKIHHSNCPWPLPTYFQADCKIEFYQEQLQWYKEYHTCLWYLYAGLLQSSNWHHLQEPCVVARPRVKTNTPSTSALFKNISVSHNFCAQPLSSADMNRLYLFHHESHFPPFRWLSPGFSLARSLFPTLFASLFLSCACFLSRFLSRSLFCSLALSRSRARARALSLVFSRPVWEREIECLLYDSH